MKKIVIISFLIIVSFASESHAGKFDYCSIVAANALLIVDWAQTRENSKDETLAETNFILGAYPSITEVDTYFAASIVLYNVAWYYLPEKYSKILTHVVIGVETYYGVKNYRIGIRFSF